MKIKFGEIEYGKSFPVVIEVDATVKEFEDYMYKLSLDGDIESYDLSEGENISLVASALTFAISERLLDISLELARMAENEGANPCCCAESLVDSEISVDVGGKGINRVVVSVP